MLAHTKGSATVTISITIKWADQGFYKDHLISTLWDKSSLSPLNKENNSQQLFVELNCSSLFSCQIISIILLSTKILFSMIKRKETGATIYNLY